MNTPNEHLRHPPGERPAAAPAHTATTVVDAGSDSAVSWAAILAGATAAAALTLVLVLCGIGLGLSAVSPWAYEGINAETFGWATIGWISFTALAASGLGGYLAGRLRRKWTGVHTDETYFRDTAHGFLSWAVATLLTAVLLTSAIGSMLGAGARAGANLAGTVASTAATGGMALAGAAGMGTDDVQNMLDYQVDRLFRDDGNQARNPQTRPSDMMSPAPATGDMDSPGMQRQPAPYGARDDSNRAEMDRTEAARIVMQSLRSEQMDPDDTRYLGRQIAARTGLNQSEAEARVTEMHQRLRTSVDELETTTREAADTAREASAYAALWLVITLLLGAFSASLLATFGGRQRDL